MKTRKVVASGLVALLAAATLAACGDAPEEDTTTGGSGSERSARRQRLPALHRLRRRRLRRQVVQPAQLRGRRAGRRRARRRADAVESNSENDFAPNLESLVGQGCDVIVTVGFALASATKESAAANPDIEYVLIDDSADGGDDGATFDGKADVAQHQAAALQHRPGRVPGRLRRCRLHQDRQGRHLRRHALPDRHDLHGRLQAGRGVLRQGEEEGRQGRRLGRQERFLHRWLRGQRGRDQHRQADPRPGRRRDPAGRRPDLPGRDHRDRGLRQGRRHARRRRRPLRDRPDHAGPTS